MSWRYRPGFDPDSAFGELEAEFGLENIVDIPIEEEFPIAGPQEASIHFVDNGGTWLVLLFKGNRYRVQLNQF